MRHWRPSQAAAVGAPVVLNDVQTQLNPVSVARVVSVRSVADVRRAIDDATVERRAVSVAGGRHAQGGQQFGEDSIHLDTRAFNRLLTFEPTEGWVDVEGGMQWPELITALHAAQQGVARPWTIRQKQTGVDHVSLAATLAANAHGRGLRFPSIIGDIEAFDLAGPDGDIRTCSRTEHPDLFRLAVGGYGLFGIVTRVRLRLTHRRKLQRVVKMIEIRDLLEWVQRRIDEGYLYGDCQYSIEPRPDSLSHPAVFACYRPVEDDGPMPPSQKALSPREWLELLVLAHTDKKRAFDAYARHYLETDGQYYWSDTHQMSGLSADYHGILDRRLGATHKGCEQITEVYVRPDRLMPFLSDARALVRDRGLNLIYGTIRFLEGAPDCHLAVAPERTVCVLCNMHIDRTDEGTRLAMEHYRRLIDLVIGHGGRYFLTYNRWATREQVEACWPQMREFLRLKRAHDPDERFQSEWYRHYRAMFGNDR